MDMKLKTFIDDYIREHADKEKTVYGYDYELMVGCDTDEASEEILINNLMTLDRAAVREIILDHAQYLINKRIRDIEQQDSYSDGFRSRVDLSNGEVIFDMEGAA